MKRLVIAVATLVLLVGAGSLCAQESAPESSVDVEPVRTNLWLVESLMEDIVAEAAAALPTRPTGIRLDSGADTDGNELLRMAAVRVLGGLGHEVYAAGEDSARQAAVDFEVRCEARSVDLSYPEVGRTLGIWRQWVHRDLQVTAMIEVIEEDSGRILFSDLVNRRFGDRIPNGDFDGVSSPLYEFTEAEVGESGWQDRLEEMVVLGTLAGLVAVYFSNTN